MKKITLLLLTLFVSTLGFSQELLENGDFETGDETGWTGNAANVVTENGNSYNSANVTQAGDSFNVNLSQIEPMTSGLTYQLSFDAWSDQTRTMIVGIGLNEDPWTSNTQEVTLGTSPQNYSMLLVANFTNTNSRVIFDMGAAVGFVGIDNVSLMEVAATCSDGVKNGDETGVDCGGSNCNACVANLPTSVPAAPTASAADVISLFSDTYTAVTTLNPTTFDTNANTAKVVSATGNDVYQFNIVDGEFQGFSLEDAIDLTEMENFHFDLWIHGTIGDGAVFNSTISYHSGGHLTGQTTGHVHTNPVNTGQDGQWISVDVPFSSFAPNLATSPRDIISQIVFTYTNLTSNELYVDNIYFYKSSGDNTGGPTTAAPTIGFDSPSDGLSLFTGTNDVTSGTNAFAGGVIEDVMIDGNPTKKLTGTGAPGWQFTPNPFADATDFDNMFFHMYIEGTTSAGHLLNLQLQQNEGGITNITYSVNIDAAAKGTWVAVDVPLTSFENATSRNALSNIQFQVVGGDTSVPIYFDNVAFYKAGTLSSRSEELIEASAFPNPTKRDWIIRTMNSNIIKSIEVYNLLGKRVVSLKTDDSEVSIPSDGLTRGIYLARIETELGSKSMKLIKE